MAFIVDDDSAEPAVAESVYKGAFYPLGTSIQTNERAG